MIELKTKLRKWGNSFGVVVPLSKINQGNIKEGEELTVFLVKDKINLKRLFGAHKFKKTTEQMMREIDKELYND